MLTPEPPPLRTPLFAGKKRKAFHSLHINAFCSFVLNFISKPVLINFLLCKNNPFFTDHKNEINEYT